MDKHRMDLLCPSAQPDMSGARVIGVISGTKDVPQIAFLQPGVSIDTNVTARLGDLAPSQVFRFAAACEQARCAHFDGARCSLAGRIVEQLPEVVDILPVCQVRSDCRWFSEQGGAACRRCPQVITAIPKRDDALNRAAMPDIRSLSYGVAESALPTKESEVVP